MHIFPWTQNNAFMCSHFTILSNGIESTLLSVDSIPFDNIVK